jgi:hypothetical protein
LAGARRGRGDNCRARGASFGFPATRSTRTLAVIVSEYRLTSEILARSVAKHWEAAKREWSLAEVYEAEEPETCLCGHFPIVELCILTNARNANTATVGNCCVKKFIGLPSDKIFTAVKRVRKDRDKSLNEEAIEHAHLRRWINEWERDFYLDVMNKRKLSERQLLKKQQINEKMLENMRRKK